MGSREVLWRSSSRHSTSMSGRSPSDGRLTTESSCSTYWWGRSLVVLQKAGEPVRAAALCSRGFAGDWCRELLVSRLHAEESSSRPGEDSWVVTRNAGGSLWVASRLGTADKAHVESLGWHWSAVWTELTRMGGAAGPDLWIVICKRVGPRRACWLITRRHLEFCAFGSTPETSPSKRLFLVSADIVTMQTFSVWSCTFPLDASLCQCS